jgi:hypothetical protein
MKSFPSVNQETRVAEQITLDEVSLDTANDLKPGFSKKIRGGFFLVLGYLLSPLCWWNDLIFNLPIAYCFGYICSFFSSKLLLPGSILGYWLSNIVGILLMQVGAMDVFQHQPQKRNLRKELLTGFISSTVYTLAILALIQLKILDAPVLFSGS